VITIWFAPTMAHFQPFRCIGLHCGKPIEANVEYIKAAFDDIFHEACFGCCACGKVIKDGYNCLLENGSERKYKHQKGFYYHPECANTNTKKDFITTQNVQRQHRKLH